MALPGKEYDAAAVANMSAFEQLVDLMKHIREKQQLPSNDGANDVITAFAYQASTNAVAGLELQFAGTLGVGQINTNADGNTELVYEDLLNDS